MDSPPLRNGIMDARLQSSASVKVICFVSKVRTDPIFPPQEKSKRPSPGAETADENDPFGAESPGLRSKLIPPL